MRDFIQEKRFNSFSKPLNISYRIGDDVNKIILFGPR